MLRALALLPAVLLGASCIEEAHAMSTSTQAIGIAQQAAAVGPASVDSFSKSCTTTASLIYSGDKPMLSYSCQVSGTTKVAVGDSAIADPTDGQNSPVFCDSGTCPEAVFGGNVKNEYCRADSGTVTVYCRALVSTPTAP